MSAGDDRRCCCHPGLVPGSLTVHVRDPPDKPGDDNQGARGMTIKGRAGMTKGARGDDNEGPRAMTMKGLTNYLSSF